MKKIKYYQAKTLFNGAVINKNGYYVAVPDKYKEFKIIVQYDNREMIIEKWLNADGFRKFPDKFGRRDINGNTIQYTLGYFKWNPIVKEENLTTQEALIKMADTPKWEDLRKKLHSK